MTALLGNWNRPHFHKPGGRPLLFYAVYGSFGTLAGLSASTYRSQGIPAGFSLMHYGPAQHPEVLVGFREGIPWDDLQVSNASLANQIEECRECLLLRGEIEDPGDLNYFRDSVGLLTFLLDHGGIAIYDPYIFKWWEPEDWRKRIFEPASAVPGQHVVLLTSEESDPALTWFHSRGMRKFGRPELSVHNVPAKYRDAIIDLCERFIQLQAFGGVIDEGQEIRIKNLPTGMTCHHAGDLDDPDFNNSHVEIRWN